MSKWGSDPGKDRGRGIAFTLSFGVPVAGSRGGHQHAARHQDRQGVRRRRGRQSARPREFRESGRKAASIWGLGHAMNAELTYADGDARADELP